MFGIILIMLIGQAAAHFCRGIPSVNAVSPHDYAEAMTSILFYMREDSPARFDQLLSCLASDEQDAFCMHTCDPDPVNV